MQALEKENKEIKDGINIEAMRQNIFPIKNAHTAFIGLIKAARDNQSKAVVIHIGVVVANAYGKVLTTYRAYGAPCVSDWTVTGKYHKVMNKGIIARCPSLEDTVIRCVANLIKLGVTRVYFDTQKTLGSLKGTCVLEGYSELSNWLTDHGCSFSYKLTKSEDVSFAAISKALNLPNVGVEHDGLAQAFKMYRIWSLISERGQTQDDFDKYIRRFRIATRDSWNLSREIAIGEKELANVPPAKYIIDEYDLD